MLSQMVYWQGRTSVGNDDWFYKTQEEWFEETALSDESQVTARRQLCKLGVLEEKRKGPRRQLWFKINMKKLVDLVQEQNKLQIERNEKRVSENLGASTESRVREPRGQESEKAGVESPGTSDSLLTKNTTKTTSEIIPAASQPEGKIYTKHFEFQKAYEDYWVSKNDIAMPWDGSEARALTVFMKTNPSLSVAGFTRLLLHRADSDVNHSERPRSVIPRLTDYARSSLDIYNKPKSKGGNKSDEQNKRIDSGNSVIHDWLNATIGGDPEAPAASELPTGGRLILGSGG
jgi:hypothetical protein